MVVKFRQFIWRMLLLFWAVCFAQIGLARMAAAQQVAITIDDLPYVMPSRVSPEEGALITQQVVVALAAYDAPALGFAVGQNMQGAGVQALNVFAGAGHPLGNHSWSHPDFGELSAWAFRRELLRTDRQLSKWSADQLGAADVWAFGASGGLFEETGAAEIGAGSQEAQKVPSGQKLTVKKPTGQKPAGQKLVEKKLAGQKPAGQKWFRFPYLREGKSAAQRDAGAKALAKQGYRNVPVTIDTDDWVYNDQYMKALADGNAVKALEIGAAYLAHMQERTAHFDALAQKVLGREVPHILLLHMNKINADYLEELLGWYAQEGWQFVSVDKAMQDAFYDLPDVYVGPKGLSKLERVHAVQ